MKDPTNWAPGLVVLGLGAVGAIAYLLTARRAKAEVPVPDSVDDLQARYDALLIELKEHVANRHLSPAAEWEAERARLETAAAAVLREKSNLKHEALKTEARTARVQEGKTEAPTFAERHPTLMGALIGGTVVGFFVFLASQLSSATAPRQEGMTATGTVPPAGAPMQPAPEMDTRIPALLQAVKAAPDDVDAVANLVMYMIRKQAFDEARPYVQRATLMDPFHPRIRVARAVLSAIDSDANDASLELERLGRTYTDGYEGLMYAGLIAIESNDSPRALRNLEAYVAIAPQDEQPPFLRMALMQLKQPQQ